MTHPSVRSGWWPLWLVGALVAGAAVVARFGTLEFTDSGRSWQPPEPVPTAPPPEPPPSPPPAMPPTAGSSWLAPVLTWVGVLFGAVLLGLLLWSVLRHLLRALRLRPAWLRLRRLPAPATVVPATGPALAVAEEQVCAAVDEAVVRSEDEPDPRRAVIACWVRLGEVAGQVGVPRHPSDTAADLVVRLLRGFRVSEPGLAGFADVYRRARFAADPVDERMRHQARSALRRLRGELRPDRPAPGATE